MLDQRSLRKQYSEINTSMQHIYKIYMGLLFRYTAYIICFSPLW